jgi:hypothetical protein
MTRLNLARKAVYACCPNTGGRKGSAVIGGKSRPRHLPSFLFKKRRKARVETLKQKWRKEFDFQMSSQNVKMRGKKVLRFRALATFFSFFNFFHSFYLIPISPLLPLFLLLSSNFWPSYSLDEQYGKNSQFYFWSSDRNIVWQCTTKFRVVSLGFMRGFYITQHIGPKQHIGRALWFGTVRSWPQFAIPARDRVEQEAYGNGIHLAQQILFSVRRNTNIRELKKISVLNLLPCYYHRKVIIDLPVRMQGLERNSIFVNSVYNDFHAQIKRKCNWVKTVLWLYLPHLQRELFYS